MAVNQTKTTNLIIPEVMADMISASLPKAVKFTPFAKIDNTLEGTPGNTVKIPSWGYVGDAETVAEGDEVSTTQMETSSKEMTIKKAVKAITLTDEAINSAYGNPVAEATHQLTLALTGKLEEDVIEALGKATLKVDKSTEQISYKGIVEGVDKLAEEEDSDKFLFIAPAQLTTLRLDPTFIDKSKYGNDVMMTGEVGMVAGCRVVVSRRVPVKGKKYTNFIIATTPQSTDGVPTLPPVTIYIKQAPRIVSAYKELLGATNIVANQHYGVGLTNESKVVAITFKQAD